MTQKRETVIEEIKTRIETSLYPGTFKLVTRERHNAQTLKPTQWPAYQLISANEGRVHQPQKEIEKTISPVGRIWIKKLKADTELIDKKLNDLIEAVDGVIYADVTLGGLVISCLIINIETSQGVYPEYEFANCTFKIEYNECF